MYEFSKLLIYRFAESFNCSDLSERALIYAGEHWATIAQREELLDLPFIVFSKMLSSNEFAVQNEMDIVLAVVRWLQHEPTSRAKCCPDLVRHLRLNSLPTHVLDEIWNKLLDAQLLELFRLSSEQMTAITHARPRGCVFSLYLVGGSVENMDSEATVLKYDVHKRTWEIMAPMATPRYNVGVAALGGRLYAVGGYMYNLNYEETLSTGEVYDPTHLDKLSRHVAITKKIPIVYERDASSLEELLGETNKWSPMAAMDEAREGMGVVVFNEKLYVFGGDGAYGELSSIEAYDPEADKWTPAGDMPHALYNMSIVTHRGAIYIAGGKMPSCTSKSLLRYEPTAGLRGEWRYCAEMSRRRHGHAAAVLDDWLYVIGGYDDANGIMDSVTRYDFGTPSESRWSPLPMDTQYVADLIGRNKISGVENGEMNREWGGVGASRPANDKDRWEDVAPLQQGRAACAAGAAGGALLVAGGHDGSHLSSLETYAAADDCWRRGPDMPWPCSDVGYAVLRY
ncbi:Kelch-like protein 17 [Eumeta japonica]|uniref:Kelch-like protein 17 n=1 Tax=Eumeta variegata TaxID=151549 RepID=A0A4C1YDP5_EUMVA|nr:Kelch-like protein 17 [Eumeta japonica]